MGHALLTQSMSFRKARKTNSTVASFSARAHLGTEPLLDTDAGSATAQVAIDRNGRGGVDGLVQNLLMVMPYAVGADNVTFGCRVYGWRKIGNDPNTLLWVAILLADLDCTAGASVGVAGRQVVATERFADTITLVDGVADFVKVYSPANDTPGYVIVDLLGCQKYELEFETGASATSMNALVCEL